MEKICNKIRYFTEKEADIALREMVEGNDYRSWKRQTNCRKYLCPYCTVEGYPIYHLTSKISINET